jgi:hypothetical protein
MKTYRPGFFALEMGFALRANGSKFAFRPESIEDEDKDTAVAHTRTLFLQNNVVCYVLTLAAVSKGKQLVLFTAEDEFGLMVGHREIIMQPDPHLGPLEIIDSDFAEGDLSVCFHIKPKAITAKRVLTMNLNLEFDGQRDQSQNPLTAGLLSPTYRVARGARRLISLTDRRKLFFPRARTLLPCSLSIWPCGGSAKIDGAAVMTSRLFGG